MDINFILCDIKEDLCKEWDAQIRAKLTPEEQARFSILSGPLQQLKGTFDCIVSPANSYARLDGSFDLVISKTICPGNPEAVTDYCQRYVQHAWNGYQVPGTCLLIPVSSFGEKRYQVKYIAHCPTMRVPGNCRWNKDIVYNCIWSLLNALRIHNRARPEMAIKSVFVTGLGTGIGRFPSETCAAQMILAYRHFMDHLAKTDVTTSWNEVFQLGLDIDETIRTTAFLS